MTLSNTVFGENFTNFISAAIDLEVIKAISSNINRWPIMLRSQRRLYFPEMFLLGSKSWSSPR